MDNSSRNDRCGNDDGNRLLWRFVDGALSISVSMLLAALLRDCLGCGGLPILGYLHGLAVRDDGVIIVGTILLFPTTAAIYGGIKMFFAAREAVRREARARARRAEAKGHQEGRQEGIQEGIKEGLQAGQHRERERIRKELARQGIAITPEIAGILNGDDK